MSVTVRIQNEAIDMEPLVRELTTPDCGAVLVFHGVVRDQDGGRPVEAIDYSSYAGMAESELGKVAQVCAERHAVSHVAVVHRLGRLRVGEASLGLVVAAPHRRPAFECGLEIIDEMKKSVPIWKKEIGPDGSQWK